MPRLSNLVRPRSFGFAGQEGELFDQMNQNPNSLASLITNESIRGMQPQNYIQRTGGPRIDLGPSPEQTQYQTQARRPSGSDLMQQSILAGRSQQQAMMDAQRFLQANPDMAGEQGFSQEELAAQMGDNTFSNILQQRAKDAYAQEAANAKQAMSPADVLAREKFEYEKSKGVVGGVAIPKLTEAQAKATTFASQMAAASNELDNLEAKGFDPSGIGSQLQTGMAGGMGNFLASPEAQQAKQTQNQWSEAFLRVKTGAAATEPEVQLNNKTFFPQIGDSPAVIEQKRRMRVQAENDVLNMTGGGRDLATQRQAPQQQTSNQDSDAIAWARANPNDPRSARILSLHGM